MSEPRWPDGDDRRPLQGGRPGAHAAPDPGARDRDRALYRNGRGAYADGGGAYGHDRGVRSEPYRPPSEAGHGPRRWGALPGSTGVCIVIVAAALGALITAVTGSQPGLVLGVLLVGGTIAAALAVRPRAAYLLIPVPALTYLVAAALAGLISDRAAGTSGTALAVNGAQWIASGFIAMAVATGLAIMITLVRWYTSRRDPGRPRSGPGNTSGLQRGRGHSSVSRVGRRPARHSIPPGGRGR